MEIVLYYYYKNRNVSDLLIMFITLMCYKREGFFLIQNRNVSEKKHYYLKRGVKEIYFVILF